MEREIKATINHRLPTGEWIDLEVEIIYEYDGGVRVNGVYVGEDEVMLTKAQQGEAEMACIDDYAYLCDMAQAAEEDRADHLYDEMKAREYERTARHEQHSINRDWGKI